MDLNSKILIVEDEQGLREALGLYFELRGFQVTAVESSEEACEVLDDSKFDIILSDINMPGVNGMDLARILKDAKTPGIPIAMTAGLATVEQARAAGFQGLVHKPFELKDIITALDNIQASN